MISCNNTTQGDKFCSDKIPHLGQFRQFCIGLKFTLLRWNIDQPYNYGQSMVELSSGPLMTENLYH